MDKNASSDSLGWGASFFMQATEDATRAFFAATSAATVQSPRPSVVYSLRDDTSNSNLQKLRNQVTKMIKGYSPPPEVKGTYNPEVLTRQKRQWARFHLKSTDCKSVKEPSRIFESMVIVGLHPNTDVRDLEKLVTGREDDDMKKPRNILGNHQQVHAAPSLEPQVLFAYPPEKRLPLKYKDLLSFCFPAGIQVHAVERTPSLSELNEILLGQEQFKESSQSFVFRLQVPDDSTLYGCCVLVEEIVQKPSNLVSMLLGEKPSFSSLSRYIVTTPRCYCLLSKLPFFDLHFGVLRSIFIEERLELLTKGVDMLNLLSSKETNEDDGTDKLTDSPKEEQYFADDAVDQTNSAELSIEESSPKRILDNRSLVEDQPLEWELDSKKVIENENNNEINQGGEDVTGSETGVVAPGDCDNFVEENSGDNQSDVRITDDVLPLLRCHVYESSDSSASFQGSPCEDRNFRSDIHDTDHEEPSSIGHEDSDAHNNILEWAKANNHGSLQVICEYYRLKCPRRGSSLAFQPLEHLHPLEFNRPGETTLSIAGSQIDVRSCSTSFEVAEVNNALLAEEESTALSVWTIACLCGCLRLENVLTLFAAALLEKQIVVICSNMGILSASVLSVIPLIRPYQWQSLLMPVLPDDMLEFLDAPVPYIVGVKNKTADVQSKLANVVLVDANKNQVKPSSMPQLPRQRELLSSLRPYHAKLVGESYLARKRPVYECTDVQAEAAKGFLSVLRSYLDSLCSNLRSHTITNVQSNSDKVSLLLKESFLGSFPNRDRPFMKLFVDTQLFSVHTDLVLSFYQKD
ncbi:uncharacterized protein LOC109711569 isoform X1 [Ananas comosus]|uniref:Uncharacterized protein LOC109711569 isoform X1 n=1 Tax=Ananas comosus TaxID=4615 RepID=A0A6P5FA07_ANACO|nr:uncharacterized protein LOC109711569 isoform X1 [Ananas comosus]XP_020090290.1 uncharacterized protein LOC109711569 isoform X1 [Ananas comosus]XP_020090292.1 uncharacterized protein LOC109711569 isoform X1 [Ananas comosus]XP_020090293.1 uncharacterized protein LOC109711569 isoform X1 [Ananas comosus]